MNLSYQKWGYNEDGSPRNPDRDFAMVRSFLAMELFFVFPVVILLGPVFWLVVLMGW